METINSKEIEELPASNKLESDAYRALVNSKELESANPRHSVDKVGVCTTCSNHHTISLNLDNS